ncbi:MAG: hypothetical protein ACLSTJ_07740 [Clostridium neonatale]
MKRGETMNAVGVMLQFFDNFSNGINNAINSANNLGASFDNINNAANIDLNTSQFDSIASSASNVATQIDNWTEKLGNYDKGALEAVYSTEELVQMGFKTQNALQGIADVGKEIPPPLDNATKEQDKLNRSINIGSGNMNGFVSKVGNLLKTYLGFQAAKKGITETIGGAMELQQQLFTMQGIMGNSDVATAYFDNLQKKANESVFSFEDFAQNARNFMQFTKNTDTLDSLANLSERLALVDPTQGLQGAGFALKEMMSGDGTSLKERFGFGKADIEILKASKDMGDFLTQFDTLLSKKGFTEDMLAQYNQSAAAQFDNLGSNITTGLAQAGDNALEALNPLITKINQAFGNGSFDSFFNALSNGLTIFAAVTIQAANGIAWLSQYLDVFGPIVLGVAAAFGVYKLAVMGANVVTGISKGIQLASAIATSIHTGATLAATNAKAADTAAQWGLNAAILACPITWIVIGIMLLIAALYAGVAIFNHFAGTSVSATGIICGALSAAGAFIWNLFLGLLQLVFGVVEYWYNLFGAFANFFGNVFNDPIGSIIHLFGDLADNVLGVIEKIANAIDSVFGSNLAAAVQGWRGTLSEMTDYAAKEFGNGEYEAKIKSLDINSALDELGIGLDRISYKGAYNSGYNWGSNLGFSNPMDNITKGLGTDLDSWNAMQGAGDLGVSDNGANKKLNGISDKIDISNENLEMLKDSTENKSIQNFVNLSPSVTFGDTHVKEEADINKIISKIETYMDEEIANSAEGVYGF